MTYPEKWEGSRIVHFAPERFLYDFFSLERGVEYHPCDLMPEVYPFGRIEKVDITSIQYDDNSMDVVLCNHVLEHVPADGRAMRELYRILKPGGWGIVQVPIDMSREKTYEDPSMTTASQRESAFGQDDHVRIYGRDYPDRLMKAGFKVLMDDFVHRCSPEDITKYGFDSMEQLFIIEK